MKLKKISGKNVEHALGFYFDGCHKIYVAETKEDIQSMKKYWGKMAHLRPMNGLEEVFKNSCSLRFISWVNIKKPCIVPQCAKRVTFEYTAGKRVIKFK